jgi:hypothetical protein
MHRIALVLALVAAFVPALWLGERTRAHQEATATYEDVYYVPPPTWLNVFSLGHDEALADLLWLRALVYFGDEMAHRGSMRHVFRYTDAMLTLDPDFRAVYEWIATAGLYHPQAISIEDAHTTIEYLRRARERFPDDGELAWILGATLAFELPPMLTSEEEKREAREEGAEHLIAAARMGAGPEWLALTNASILTRVGRSESAVAHLEEMYSATRDDATRARLAAAIASMRSEAYAAGLEESWRAEEEQRLRELPYVSPDLYFVLGPRPVVDWRDAYRRGFAPASIDAARLALEDEALDDGGLDAESNVRANPRGAPAPSASSPPDVTAPGPQPR